MSNHNFFTLFNFSDEGENNAKETYNETRNRCLGRYWQNIPFLIIVLDKTHNENVESGSQIVLSILHSNENISKECFLNISDLGVR